MKTDRTQAWAARLRRRLSKRGTKADLARFLTSSYGQTERVWASRIGDILENRHMTRVEIYLAIEDFLSKS